MNQSIFYYLNNLAGKSVCFDSIVVFCGEYLPYILVAGFLLILIFSKKDFKEKIKFFIFAAISIFLSRAIITEIIRYFYYHPRPFVNDAVHQLIFHETSSSFPSGHAAFFFALATAIYLNRRRTSVLWPILFFLGAVSISLARVIAGIHWPADIIVGAIVGIASSCAIFLILKRRLQKSLENI